MIINSDLWQQIILPFLHTSTGAVIFIPFYAIWVTFLLPGVWASMLAGVLYGTWLGSLIVFCGACIGAEVSFLLGRTLFRDWVNRRLSNYAKLQAVKKAVSREGLKLVLLTRLSPAFPFSLLNFVYGLSEVSFRDYTIGLIGILPGTILFCALGEIAGDLARFEEVLSNTSSSIDILIRITTLLTTIAVIWLVSYSARKALQESDPSF